MAVTSDSPDLGRYRLIRPLGRGGMGDVHLAHDVVLDREVAIKFVSTEGSGGPEAQRRLIREAQAVAGLDHPGICVIHETGETRDGRAYIVMQYVEGQPLSAILQQGPMPVREALWLCTHVAEALGAAHRRGVIHRDLKPSNIMVTASGHPKLLDFGIAKVVVVPAGVSEMPTSSNATTGAGIVGTPAYMSPEQVQQRPLDGRSDLFSLGIVLFECLTGRRPFDGRTSVETVANVLHVHPPTPSSLRPGLTEAHDELCRRLLAKDAADRFQSADEVVGAMRLLVPDTSRTPAPPPLAPRRRRRLAGSALAGAVILALVATGWSLSRTKGLPPVPVEADEWYQRGTDAIRRGSYVSGRRALEEAVRVFPSYALAHARLAEVNAELDDYADARDRLLRVSMLVPNELRLPETERLRLQALRSMVLRDVDDAVTFYRRLAEGQPRDAGAWVDLGRALEAAGLRGQARDSYKRAIGEDRQYAAAYLRLGYLESLEFRRDEALAAFAEAERLYRAASDVEGETEVLLRRGTMREAFTEIKEARADLERALSLATAGDTVYQQVRARLTLGSLAATEGNFAEAERVASAAVRDAQSAGLDVIAAEGLIDLAATLLQAGRLADADAALTRAMQLAANQSGERTAARARIQLAAVREAEARPVEALASLNAALPYVRQNRYRRLEFSALLLAARAHQQLDALEQAQQAAQELVTLAEKLGDEGQVALALSNLAAARTGLGAYPDALRLRERAEAIVRKQGDDATLPYHLLARAELLLLLGREGDAERVLEEIERGAREGAESFKGRLPRLSFMRAVDAAMRGRCGDAVQRASRVGVPASQGDAPGVLAPAILAFCQASPGGRPPATAALSAPALPALARERHYWLGAAALERRDWGAALDEAERGLALLGTLPNHELRWRLATIARIGARESGDASRQSQMTDLAHQAAQALATAWGADYESFTKRPDIARLRERAGD